MRERLFSVILCTSGHPSLCWLCWPSQGVLAPGSLLQLQGNNLTDQYFFVGPVLKKPRLQVLIRAFMCVADAGEEGSIPAITLLEPRTKQPEIYTSYQVFQKVLELSPESDESGCIDFVVHKYRLNPYQPLLFVTPVSASDPRQFLSSFPTLSRKVLPFGLPRPAKPSKPRKKRKLVDPPLENTVARTARSSSQQTIAGHPVIQHGHGIQQGYGQRP